MYQKIKNKFKANPTLFYACSIVASWAGVGSLMNFRTIALDAFTVASWQILIPLGVMGIWTLMSELRVYIIIFVLLASVVLHLVSDRKEDAR